MKGIIFDMDGTMVNNMMVHHQVWQKHLKKYGLNFTIDEVKEKIHGVNIEIIERLFGDRFTAKERIEISNEKEAAYREYFKPHLKLIDGLLPLLDELSEAQIPLAVGTAAPPENVDFILDTLNIRQYFKIILNSEDVKNGKPNPEIFIKAANAMGLKPEECLVFEDSVTGARTSKNAGCKSIIVTSTHDEEEFREFENIKLFIKNFTGINLNLLENLWN